MFCFSFFSTSFYRFLSTLILIYKYRFFSHPLAVGLYIEIAVYFSDFSLWLKIWRENIEKFPNILEIWKLNRAKKMEPIFFSVGESSLEAKEVFGYEAT